MNLFAIIAYAKTDTRAVDALLGKLSQYIVIPLVQFLFVLTVLLFIWGVAQFMIYSGEPSKRAQGAQHILWGVIGMAIMVAVYGIIRFVAVTIGVKPPF